MLIIPSRECQCSTRAPADDDVIDDGSSYCYDSSRDHPAHTRHCYDTQSSRPPSPAMSKLSLIGLVMLALISVAQSSPSPLLAEDGAGGTLWEGEEGVQAPEIVLIGQRERRARRLPVASLEGTSGELGWRKRYYVSRWRGGQPSRRFVPVSKNDEESGAASISIISKDEAAKRLCGLKLTNRTKELCGDCVPANMRQVILLDKKNGDNASASKDRLTEMCCVQRCTDEQIRNFCCRGQL